MITGFMESSLKTSEIFNDLNEKNKDKDIITRAINLIKNGKHLQIDDIQAAYISIKQISDSFIVAALRAYEMGDTILVFTENSDMALTMTVPFLSFKRQDKYITYVFMNRYITMTREGTYSLQAPNLRDLLSGALIANALKRNYGLLASNQYLAKVLMNIYTQFVTRIINKDYSIAPDKVVFDSLQYYINRFFLEHIFNINDSEESINIISSKHFKYVDEIQAADIKRNYEENEPKKFSELLALISTLSPRLKNINLYTFMSSWINYYFVPSMMAIDNIEYLIFMVLTLLSGNNIINVHASDIVKETKGIRDLRGELLKLI